MQLRKILLGLGAAAVIVGGIVIAKKYFLKKHKNEIDGKNDTEKNIPENESSTQESNEEDEVVIEFNINDIQDISKTKDVNSVEDEILEFTKNVNESLIKNSLGRMIDWRTILDKIHLNVIIE